MNFDSTLSAGALLTIAGAVLRLTFQHGKTMQALAVMADEVKGLIHEFKADREEMDGVQKTVALLESRLAFVERALERREGRRDAR